MNLSRGSRGGLRIAGNSQKPDGSAARGRAVRCKCRPGSPSSPGGCPSRRQFGSGATIFSIADLLKLFLSIPRGLESSSTQVAVAACFAKRVASEPGIEAGLNRRTGRSNGVADEYWTRPPLRIAVPVTRVQGRCSAWSAVPKRCPASDCCDGNSWTTIGRSLAVLALIITPGPLTTSDDRRRRRPSR